MDLNSSEVFQIDSSSMQESDGQEDKEIQKRVDEVFKRDAANKTPGQR